MASGIIEYLAEGASTKRMHPGWAAQAGLRAVELARAGFDGPRTVWEGTHGFLNGFAHTTEGAWNRLTGDFGERWVSQTIAFKPYPCGTMIHPYIDCTRRLARAGVNPNDIAAILCETAEGYVHRLWEPAAVKSHPPNAYSAKFSVPFCVGYALLHGAVGLEAFTEENARDARIAALAAKVAYVIDPDNPYPDEYTGHVRITMKDGRVLEERQPHLRGGHREPLSRADIEEKFRGNCAFGGWDRERSDAWLAFAGRAFDGGPIDLQPFRG
jgi:2-methylcitrate dehydratase PrpD